MTFPSTSKLFSSPLHLVFQRLRHESTLLPVLVQVGGIMGLEAGAMTISQYAIHLTDVKTQEAPTLDWG